MLKRALIALSFVVALAVAGVSAPKDAEAGHGYYDDYGYGGYGRAHYYPSFSSSWGYVPRHTYYRSYPRYGHHYGGHHYRRYHGHYGGHHGHHGHHRHRGHHGHHGGHHGRHGGVHFSIRF